MKSAVEVLEDAARAYRDEKIEWCAGDWARPVTYDSGIVNGFRWSMCAEGALMSASGFTALGIHAYNQGKTTAEWHPDNDQVLTYLAAKSELTAWIRANSTFRDVISFNDYQAITERKVLTALGIEETFQDLDEVQAKENVINAMEQCAKDLRNRPPRKELPVL